MKYMADDIDHVFYDWWRVFTWNIIIITIFYSTVLVILFLLTYWFIAGRPDLKVLLPDTAR